MPALSILESLASQLCLRVRRSALALAWGVLVLLLSTTAAHAAVELRTLIDSDNNPATGCSVVTPAGTFAGVDQAAVTRVDLSVADPVGDVSREICQGGVLVPDPSFVPLAPLRWPVGVAGAGVQTDVVESYTQLLTPPSVLRLGFVSQTTDGSAAPSAVLTPDGSGNGGGNGSGGGGGIQIVAPAAPPAALPVPGLGRAGLLLVAALLVAATYRFARLRRYAASCLALGLLFAVGYAWAAIVRDGVPTDWGSTPPIATAPTTGPLQISAVYAQLEGNVLHLRYDLDLGVRGGSTQDDGPFNATVGSALPVAAPGVLGNDTLGTPPMQVREFRVQGAATNTPAGGTVPFAGSTLTVRPDGSFMVGAPTAAGTFKFEYRAHNFLTPGGWSVATVDVAQAPVCGDGVRAGAEVCDDGNTVTETACPYGQASCTACNATCTEVLHLTGGFCGDGIRNGAEVCDDGNTVTETACPYGEPTCIRCNATCTATLPLTGAFCGDGVVSGSEVCDDGNTITETSCPYGQENCTRCNATCTQVLHLTGGFCGDGILQAAEVCDDGNRINETECPDGEASCTRCNATCTGVLHLNGPVCGDGVVSGAEVCDDGNTITETSCPDGEASCTRCNATCTEVLHLGGAVCGDGVVSGAEVCDDGNTINETECPYGETSCTRCNATCTATLSLTGGYCGDGVVNGTEVCDDGNAITETVCPLGQASCTVCNATCSATVQLNN